MLLLAGCSRTGLDDLLNQDPVDVPSGPEQDAGESASQSVLLFGALGETPDGGYADHNDTWIWTATDGWTQVYPPRLPSPRFGAMAASLGGDVVLFGGDGTVAETWAWSGATWTQQQPSFSPPPLTTSVFGLLGQSLLLFGGYNTGSSTTTSGGGTA